MRFRDRTEAGRMLAHALEPWRGRDAVVLGLPRGGIPVAREVATALGLPLDLAVVRRLGVPFQPELAMGAIGEGDALVLNEDIISHANVGREEFVSIEKRERTELLREIGALRPHRQPEPLAGRLAIIVDDGFATGATAIAAAAVARARGASSIVLAAPVGAQSTLERLRSVADEVVVVTIPSDFVAVGAHYDHFEPTTDEEVRRLLDRSSLDIDREVRFAVDSSEISGRLTVPQAPRAVVIFAHGSGSSRHSPRNRHVAEMLVRDGFATLLLDLLLPDEEHRHERVFDVPLLSQRLAGAVAWVREQASLHGLPVFLFGASTGSAAALSVAADHRNGIGAVVSRGGRPDLAADSLADVTCPVLLIAGGADDTVLELNREAMARLGGSSRLAVVEGAGHLFEEQGALDEVGALTRDWFREAAAAEPVTATV